MFIVPLLMPNVLRVEWRAFLAPVRRGAHGFIIRKCYYYGYRIIINAKMLAVQQSILPVDI
jgi:hypothetical protein